jgi:chromosome segregation ATPase
MANENKKINELVSEDDTTELEAVTFRHDRFGADTQGESDDDTFDVRERSGQEARTISKLKFDIEQLRARWLGLEAEIKAREEITEELTAENDGLRDTLAQKEHLLKSREHDIADMRANFDDREKQFRKREAQLRDRLEAANSATREIPQLPATHVQPDVSDSETDRLARIENYADILRRKLQDVLSQMHDLEKERSRLDSTLAENASRYQLLKLELDDLKNENQDLKEQLTTINTRHEDEIRILRFELSHAQDTVTQTETINSQLASDLDDTMNFKEELERMLCSTDKEACEKIERLENELVGARKLSASLQTKLDERGDAINILLNELAKKSEQVDSIGELGDVISDLDERIAGQFDEVNMPAVGANRSQDRVTRMLLGKVGDKLLRFPLFKDRLTIGRTADNDIQLSAAYISRRHAVVTTDRDTTRVIDWGSKNGVYVNSTRVTEHFLKSGDVVTIGNVHFRYEERPKRDT